MNKITDVTRQDIIDIVKYGVWIPYETPQYNQVTGKYEEGYTIRISPTGRLTELEFLKRIYNLEGLPSYDSRYDNAEQDIWQHTVNNDDWEPYWYFSDNRFYLLKDDDDSYLLRFICEMFHPAVRDEKTQWKIYLAKFNELLKYDGYCLVPVKQISGRDIYEAHEIDKISIPHNNETIYADLKIIGSGSYAKVFRFVDNFYQKEFALKRANRDLTEKEIARFKREYDEMKKLHSPYIIEVYAYNAEGNEYTMELMDCTLKDYIDHNNDTMTMDSRRSIILQLIRAFKYLHLKGIYHRDISSDNVLLKRYDDTIVAKLSDFGLVKTPGSEFTSENTELKGSLNDPALKIEGFGNYGILHEVYAITLLFVYILSGKNNWSKIKDPNIIEFMQAGTNPEKHKRYQSLEELEEAVKNCICNLKYKTTNS